MSVLRALDRPLVGLAILLGGALLSGLLMMDSSLAADAGRRVLVLHATLAGVLLPLALAASFAMGARGVVLAAAFSLLLAALLTGFALLAPGKTLLTTFLPTLTEPTFGLLLVAAAVLVLVALARLGMPGRVSQPHKAATAGLVWSALPLAVVLVSLAWGWTAADAEAGHIRAELATWAAGHAVLFFLASLLVWVWSGLAEIDTVRRTRWCIAAALPALVVLLVQALISIDDTRYLRAFPELLRWALWPVPMFVAISLLRDDIWRAVGAWPLAISIALFLVLPIAGLMQAVGAVGAVGGNALARGPLIVIAHALPLALILAGGALLWRRQNTGTAALAFATASHHPRVSTNTHTHTLTRTGSLVAVLAVLAMLAGTVATPPPKAPLPARLPQGDTPRQHVDVKRAEEIAQRFAQGVEMMRRKQFDFAAKAFHRVLALDPTLTEAHVNMGFALLETGDPVGAQRFFESATRLKRDQLNAYYGLALAAHAQKNHEVAVGAMRTWLHLAPANDPFRPQAEAKFDAMQRAFMMQRQAATPR